MKVCPGCRREFSIDYFTPTRVRARNYTCRSCEAGKARRARRNWSLEKRVRSLQVVVSWREANPEKQRASARRWKQEHPEQAQAHSRKWTQRNRDRMRNALRANWLVKTEIRAGRMIRSTTCEVCGAAGLTEAAHSNYSRPLDVRWLCVTCHRKWDAASPKTLARVSE